jgi:hypothetical protein
MTITKVGAGGRVEQQFNGLLQYTSEASQLIRQQKWNEQQQRQQQHIVLQNQSLCTKTKQETLTSAGDNKKVARSL